MSWDEQIARIVAKGPTGDDDRLGKPIRCVRCRDTGVIEYTGGTFVTQRGLKVEATPERPVCRRCSCLDGKDAA